MLEWMLDWTVKFILILPNFGPEYKRLKDRSGSKRRKNLAPQARLSRKSYS